MKKVFSSLCVIALILVFVGCDINSPSSTSKVYNIGDVVELGGIKFKVYRTTTDHTELYLLAQNNIATTIFSDSDRPYDKQHDYHGSLVEGYVNKFVDSLEDRGYVIKSSGIPNIDDIYELGFKDSVTVSGLPYLYDDAPDFVKLEQNFWLSGYYRVDTYQWVYFDEKIDTKSCDEEYGVRPIIVIDSSELDKEPSTLPVDLFIKDIIQSDCAWTSEGGIHNPYDRFYFDCENMIFTNIFQSPELSMTEKYKMSFVDDHTIQIEGLMRGHDFPAQITIVSETKLRVRFINEKYNDGDYFLNKES
ncbi:MAG: hypothetical protein E7439_03010 [Ruminococcaceae bacterium]|nr:hypothetical protein [Oscillospiraceae bacterium]